MTRALAAVVIVAAACGRGGVDLEGTYQVTLHTADATGCTNQQPVTDPAYVRFTPGSILGQDYFALSACTDPAQVDCPGAGLYGPFAEPIEDGWRAELGFAQPVGGCILDYVISDAVLDGANLVIDGRRYHDESDRPEAECTGETAVDLGDSLPCVGAEHLEALQLEPVRL
jgi:hypothetical protein